MVGMPVSFRQILNQSLSIHHTFLLTGPESGDLRSGSAGPAHSSTVVGEQIANRNKSGWDEAFAIVNSRMRELIILSEMGVADEMLTAIAGTTQVTNNPVPPEVSKTGGLRRLCLNWSGLELVGACAGRDLSH